jgi:integrase
VPPLVVLEQTGMEPGTLSKLTWGDVDVAESKFRLRRANVKGSTSARARMVQVPRWLMERIEGDCPLEDRATDRKVFVGLTPDAMKGSTQRACKSAGLPSFSPYDLRHRRLSLWHGQGVPAKELAERAGHSKASMSSTCTAMSLSIPLSRPRLNYSPGVVWVWHETAREDSEPP